MNAINKNENAQSIESASIRNARPLIGFLLCVIAETFYFFANFLIRCMTDYQEISPDWTLMVKELVTVSFILPIILWYVIRKKYYFPGWKIIGCILIAAFICEFVSSRAFFRSYAILGVVLAMPLYVTFQILGSNFFATTLIGEKITKLKIATTLILIAAVMFLAWSKWNPNMLTETNQPTETKTDANNPIELNIKAEKSNPVELNNLNMPKGQVRIDEPAEFDTQTNLKQTELSKRSAMNNRGEAEEQIGGEVTPGRLAWGLLITLIAGGGSALYMCIMRGVMRTGGEKQVPLTLSMFMITGSGMVIGAICLYFQRGFSSFYQVPPQCWYLTLGAGAANLIGFYFRNLGFRYVSASKIVFVSVLQVLLLTLVGISYFGEQSNSLIWYGLLLTILGIVMAGFTK